MKLSLICTVLNEENTIGEFIDSVIKQSVLPSEVIIIDGGSLDKTVRIVNKKITQYLKKLNIKLFIKKGNRSIGRNEGIKNASSEIILLTDSGCTLDKEWVKEIIKPFNDRKTDVVAGYYKGESKNIFQKSLIPYVLVMPDKVNEKEFLPATRSMAIKKSIWKKAGGFDEKLSHNEDYAFANKLKEINAKIVFEKKAIANWIPRKNLKQAFVMFFRFALGDIQASLYREKVVYLFLRYTFGTYLILLSIVMRSVYLYGFVIISFFGYISWSVWKNYKYVRNYKAFIYLPLLQFTSDAAVSLGTTFGLVQKISIKSFISLILNNKGVAVVILIYILTMISIISYGIPNPSHPFNYFMDEWHQSQSVRNLFKYGTPNIEGSANGSIFQFFLTGIYLIPFQILGLINMFAIKSSVMNLDLQFRLFEILRINTLLFGIGSIILIAYISKKYFKLNSFLTVFLFTFNPIWLMLSNYFKYDIALTFWILCSFLLFLEYINKKFTITYVLGGIFVGLALSTKLLSPLPLLAVYILIFILFTPNFKKYINRLFLGIFSCLFVYIFFGNPDIILGKGSLNEYLYSNIVLGPKIAENINFGKDLWSYLLTNLYPTTFGKVFYYSFILSIFFGFVVFLKRAIVIPFHGSKSLINNLLTILIKNSYITILFLCFVFFIFSLIPVGIQAVNNRLIVILPFVALMSSMLFMRLINYSKDNKINILKWVIVIFLLSFQLFESFSWFIIKWNKSPMQTSSEWIVKNVPQGTNIGIENIPIYQHLPDIVLKEFYLKQYLQKTKYLYKYVVVSVNSKFLPNIIVITNDNIEKNYLKKSEKNNLIDKLDSLDYKRKYIFTPNFYYYKFFNSEFDYFMSGLIQSPNTISIYEKE